MLGHIFQKSLIVHGYLNQFVRLCHAADNTHSAATVSGLLRYWRQKFEDENIPEPKESIENLMAFVLGMNKITDVYRVDNTLMNSQKQMRLLKLCERRLRRMPVQYIIGQWQFRELILKMSPPVFIPRPETEMLVDIVLQEIDSKKVEEALELCCGSGAISLALLHERKNLKMTAIDQLGEACMLTLENARKLNCLDRLSLIQHEINNNSVGFLKKKFNIIVSNPPYVFSKDMKNLEPEIYGYEDLRALDGGKDGLDIIKLILNISSHHLEINGKLYLEVDPAHPNMIKHWLECNVALNLRFVRSYKDLSGKDRFVEIIKQ